MSMDIAIVALVWSMFVSAFLMYTVHRALVRVQAIQDTLVKHLTDHEVAKIRQAFERGPDADDFERSGVDTSKWPTPTRDQ